MIGGLDYSLLPATSSHRTPYASFAFALRKEFEVLRSDFYEHSGYLT